MDLIANLYNLPDSRPVYEALEHIGVNVRRAPAYEKHIVTAWVREHFSATWAAETDAAFAGMPSGCFIATQNKQVRGFACVESTARGFFGPTGVMKSARGQGIGLALLLRAMEDLRERGYVYGIIGGAGPKEFYEKAVGAIPIANSLVEKTGETGIYQDMLE